jgi:hypothetical protein
VEFIEPEYMSLELKFDELASQGESVFNDVIFLNDLIRRIEDFQSNTLLEEEREYEISENPMIWKGISDKTEDLLERCTTLLANKSASF